MGTAAQVAAAIAAWALGVAALVVAGGVVLLVSIYVDRRRCTRQRAANLTTRSHQ